MRSDAPLPRQGPPEVWLNAIGTATPAHDIHEKFLKFVPGMLANDRDRRLFARMSQRAGISRRFSVFAPDADPDRIDRDGFYARGRFPDTGARMLRYGLEALPLAEAAVEGLAAAEGASWKAGVTHLIVTTCTGFTAPGLDAGLIARFELDPGVERTNIGFMGCNAAMNALKLARHVVRSDPRAKVLVVNLEICTLHYQETADLEQVLCFMLFADGAAASLVSAEPRGMALERFASAMASDSADLITWAIGNDGFDMRLSGEVPVAIGRHLPAHVADLLGQRSLDEIELWAVHPGGRSVLDAVEAVLGLDPARLRVSRGVLDAFGNMSSATIMFVLQRLMAEEAGGRGMALGFGPGLSIEGMAFRKEAA
jgi:alpha-pyrone synthase